MYWDKATILVDVEPIVIYKDAEAAERVSRLFNDVSDTPTRVVQYGLSYAVIPADTSE